MAKDFIKTKNKFNDTVSKFSWYDTFLYVKFRILNVRPSLILNFI